MGLETTRSPQVLLSAIATAPMYQVLNLVGSMRSVGSPADLISNIGGGARALIYAPAQGLVQGPNEFFQGCGFGAESFVKGWCSWLVICGCCDCRVAVLLVVLPAITIHLSCPYAWWGW